MGSLVLSYPDFEWFPKVIACAIPIVDACGQLIPAAEYGVVLSKQGIVATATDLMGCISGDNSTIQLPALLFRT